ncbi:beta-ketoacyl synthase N-terminal-like domain-containing protein [Streptomyces sp. NPDC005820]|uniref:beta-ketoacyl synthase N-terminal-like domain-containing protein n=1 Tax=Streptomyces sp. NPDC005820 TaxID=3157069 RepID=UPI0033CBED5C
MTAPTATAVIVGGTAPLPPHDLRPGLTVLPARASLTTAFVEVLAAALDRLPAALRTTAPVVMAATDYCVAATSRYVTRCAEAEAGGRRLRPTEAMTPEPAQLLQELAEAGDWDGQGHVLISPRAAAFQAWRWAWGTVGAGLHRAMVVCELLRDPHGNGYHITAVPVTAAAPGPTRAEADPVVASAPCPAWAEGDAVVVSASGPARAEGDPVVASAPCPARAEGDAVVVSAPCPARAEGDPVVASAPCPARAEGDAVVVSASGPARAQGDPVVASAPGPARAEGDAVVVSGSGPARTTNVPVTAADPGPGPGPARTRAAPVVVSGTGLVTAFGDGGEVFWRNLLDGSRALTEPTRFDASRFRGRTVCQTGVEPSPGQPVRRTLLDRARTEALREAGVEELPPRTLLVLAGVVPHLPQVAGAPRIEEIALEPDWDGDGLGIPARNTVLMAHACASGAFGLALAREWLLCGLADLAVVTGVSSLNTYDYACLDVLRATSTTAARPFDEDRSGVTVGEGAGAIVLETAERAAARGHRPRATLSGISCRVAGQGVSRLNAHIGAACMREALAMAGLTTVDLVHGHAPGTRQGDEAELLALDQVGAEHDWRGVPVSSYKGAAGHLLHASVFPGVVAAVLALRDQVLPGTPGLRKPLDARHVRVLRDPEPGDGTRSVLVNNFGFGGNNAALLLTDNATGRREWSTDG